MGQTILQHVSPDSLNRLLMTCLGGSLAVQAQVASIKVKECRAEYIVCSEPSKPLPKGAVSYDFLFSYVEQMAADHQPNMTRLAFTQGVLVLQAVAVWLAAELSKLRNLDLNQRWFLNAFS